MTSTNILLGMIAIIQLFTLMSNLNNIPEQMATLVDVVRQIRWKIDLIELYCDKYNNKL